MNFEFKNNKNKIYKDKLNVLFIIVIMACQFTESFVFYILGFILAYFSTKTYTLQLLLGKIFHSDSCLRVFYFGRCPLTSTVLTFDSVTSLTAGYNIISSNISVTVTRRPLILAMDHYALERRYLASNLM